jgi:hypothetical protein
MAGGFLFAGSCGYVLVFASEEGGIAREPSTEPNGYFTKALLEQLGCQGHLVPLSQVLSGVSASVQAATSGLQTPVVFRTAKEDFVLFELEGSCSLPLVAATSPQVQLKDIMEPLWTAFSTQVIMPYF